MADLYTDLTSVKSFSSGQGGSYYALGGTCGMKSRLTEMFPYDEDQEEQIGALTKTGKRKANGRRAGSFYHALQYRWRTGRDAPATVYPTSHEDYDYELACNSFSHYRTRARGDIHNRGRIVNAEVKYPATEADANVIKAALGDLPFTIRYDLLVDISEHDRERLAIENGLALPRVGLYLVDYKLLASIGDDTVENYCTDFQSLSYPLVYNLLHPDRPVEGMIFDIMARVQEPKEHHYALGLAIPNQNALQIVKHNIALSHARHTEGAANMFACQGKYKPCFFRKMCPKFGTFAEHEAYFKTLKP